MTDSELKEQIQKTIAQRISTLCGEGDARITQEALAQKIGITRQAVTAYENGQRKPSIATLYQIAKTCNVSVDWLVGLSEDPSPVPAAVDELGLPLKTVALIREWRDVERSTPPCVKGLYEFSFLDFILSSSCFIDALHNLQWAAMLQSEATKTKPLEIIEDELFKAMDNGHYICDSSQASDLFYTKGGHLLSMIATELRFYFDDFFTTDDKEEKNASGATNTESDS